MITRPCHKNTGNIDQRRGDLVGLGEGVLDFLKLFQVDQLSDGKTCLGSRGAGRRSDSRHKSRTSIIEWNMVS
jgi:hypothetical protein